MKVSLSASHANCPAAIELLRTCDLIYTTQINNFDSLEEQFPDAIVKVIPDCCPDLIEFLKIRHQSDEVIGIGELMTLRMQHECHGRHNSA